MVGAKMTANELADELDNMLNAIGLTDNRVPTMLRQQQAEIEALKKDNKELHAIAQRMAMAESDARKSLQWFKEAKEMNNEPVAWAVWEGSVHDMFFTKEDADELCRLKGGDAKTVPLYTHPVSQYKAITNTKIEPTVVSYTHPVKELTYGDGIEECAQRAEACAYMSPNFIALAEELRAILRKAQEK